MPETASEAQRPARPQLVDVHWGVALRIDYHACASPRWILGFGDLGSIPAQQLDSVCCSVRGHFVDSSYSPDSLCRRRYRMAEKPKVGPLRMRAVRLISLPPHRCAFSAVALTFFRPRNRRPPSGHQRLDHDQALNHARCRLCHGRCMGVPSYWCSSRHPCTRPGDRATEPTMPPAIA